MAAYTGPLSPEGRSKLKTAIRAELRRRGQPVDRYGNVSSMNRDSLIAAATALELNIHAVLDFGEVEPEPAPEPTSATTTEPAAPAAEPDAGAAEEVTETTREEEGPDPIPPTQGEIDARTKHVLEPFAEADMAEVKRRLAILAATALRGPRPVIRTIERTRTIRVEVPALAGPREGEAPHATRAGTATLRELFGVQGRAGDVKLSTWTSPLAARRDPAWRWNPDLMTTIGIALSKGHPVMLHGPRGTGKSSLAEQVAAATGREFTRISCTDTTEAQELVGKHGPDGRGGITWIDGQLTAAIRRPGNIVLVDEPSIARAGAIMILQSVMDSARVLFIAETGERVPVAPGTVVVLADNTPGTGDATGQYEGTGRLNAATLDRPAVNVRVAYMEPGQEAAMLAQRTGCREALALMLANFAARTREASDQGHVVEGLSPRRLMALATLIHYGARWEQAWRDAVLNSAPAADKEHLSQMASALIDASAIERAAL